MHTNQKQRDTEMPEADWVHNCVAPHPSGPPIHATPTQAQHTNQQKSRKQQINNLAKLIRIASKVKRDRWEDADANNEGNLVGVHLRGHSRVRYHADKINRHKGNEDPKPLLGSSISYQSAEGQD